MNFSSRSILITGAGRGIGKRLALGFAEKGARIGLLARSKPELDVTSIEVQQRGGSAVVLPADIRSYQALCQALESFGPPDVLICAAAIQGPIAPLTQAPPELIADTITTNLTGIMYCLRAVLPLMQQRRQGKIIVLSGGGSMRPRPFFSAYAATKTALVRLVETVAQEVVNDNIQINCMGPGGTYTSMTDEILQAGDAAGVQEFEDARQIRITGGVALEKQLALTSFLASEASNHITGRLIHVTDDWKRLADEVLAPNLYTLRRVQKPERSS